MSNKGSRPIRNGAIASIISGIALTFFEPFNELLAKAVSWFWAILVSLWEWLLSSHEIYGWVLTLLVLMAIPTLFWLVFLIFKKTEPGVEDLYQSDHLFGADWQWQYSIGAITDLWCLCPTCHSELVYTEFTPNRYDYTHDGLKPKTDFICERCNITRCTLKGNRVYALGIVEREIRRKIRSNEW